MLSWCACEGSHEENQVPGLLSLSLIQCHLQCLLCRYMQERQNLMHSVQQSVVNWVCMHIQLPTELPPVCNKRYVSAVSVWWPTYSLFHVVHLSCSAVSSHLSPRCLTCSYFCVSCPFQYKKDCRFTSKGSVYLLIIAVVKPVDKSQKSRIGSQVMCSAWFWLLLSP